MRQRTTERREERERGGGGERERERVSATDRQHKSLWLSNNNTNKNKNKGSQGGLCHAVCVAGGAGFVVCWVGSTFHRWDLPLHASRVALRVLSSILGENASAATIW